VSAVDIARDLRCAANLARHYGFTNDAAAYTRAAQAAAELVAAADEAVGALVSRNESERDAAVQRLSRAVLGATGVAVRS
jgi:hypothetical protein